MAEITGPFPLPGFVIDLAAIAAAAGHAQAAGEAALSAAGTKEAVEELAVQTGLAAEAAARAAYGVPFLSYAEALAGDKPAPLIRVFAICFGRLLTWLREPGGPCLGGGWAPDGDVTPEHFGAVGDRITDDGPAFRAARDYLASKGGGTIKPRARPYLFASTETRSYYLIGTSSSSIQAVPVCLALPAGVSLVGPNERAELTCSIVSAAAIVALEDYGHGAIADVDIVGMGADGNATHGILTMVTDDTEHVIERMRLERISVRDVGSYGIGMQYCGVRGCVVRDIDIKNTGSDGIDWKIRGPNGQKTPSESVVFDTISIRTFGVRLPGGSSTGIGLRGMAQLKNISIFDIGPGQVGLALMPGINAIATADLRRSAIYAEVNGVYVEGRGPRQEQPAIGVQAYAVDRCIISGVVARHCTISDQVAATSPPAPLHGPVWRNLMITPPHGAYAAMTVSLHRSSVELVVQSDYDWFDVRAGTATVGQTVFVLPLGAPTAGYAVIRNQTKLALGVGYTISGGTITLANPMGATDTVCVVYPPERAIRVNGDSCVITGECDEFCSYGVNYATAQNVATGNNLGFTWRNRPSLNKQATASAQLLVTSPNTDEDLRLIPQGAGRVRVENGLRLGSTTCPTGTFTTVDGKTVTITGGVVVGIS